MPRESGAFALAGFARRGNEFTTLVRRPLEIPGHLFTVQHEYRLEFSSLAISGLASLCEANNLGAVICHSHPEDIPYSPSDDMGERRIANTLQAFAPRDTPVASLLFWPDGMRGRIWFQDRPHPVPIDEIIAVGRCLQRTRPERVQPIPIADTQIYSRQVLAFGETGQAAISATKVGIVGVGGTGSAVAEQLARLGVIDFVLIDPDSFEKSNLTRVYGTFPTRWQFSVHQPKKVKLIEKHLRRINPFVTIVPIAKHVAETVAAQALLDRDVIFLCTDEHWGRSIVNQIAYQYLIPTINLGARIDSGDGQMAIGGGSVDLLLPDKPCLWCKNILRADRIAAESMPRSKRNELQRLGYVEGIHGVAPAVVSLTTTVAGLAVNLFLQLLTDFMLEAGDVSRLNFDLLTGTVRRGTTAIADNCICAKVRGYGQLKSLPTQDNLEFLSQ
jgi:hypothetical protein